MRRRVTREMGIDRVGGREKLDYETAGHHKIKEGRFQSWGGLAHVVKGNLQSRMLRDKMREDGGRNETPHRCAAKGVVFCKDGEPGLRRNLPGSANL